MRPSNAANQPGGGVAASFRNNQFTCILGALQIIFMIILAIYSNHAPGALPTGLPEVVAQVNYTDFQDIHITLIAGFGFLVAFLRRYGFASFSLSLLLVAFTIEWALIVRGFLSDSFQNHKIFTFTIHGLVMADFSAAVVLVSFGALIGKLSPVQCLLLAVIEVPVSILNEWLVIQKWRVQDAGGAIIIHVFGAIFGLAASKVLFKKQWAQSEHLGAIYHSEVFAFVGTAFLWVLWPAWNAVNLVGDARNRAIINTYMALVGSAVAAFLTSQALNRRHQLNVRHIASAAIAGGVALGACSNLIINPWHAWILGNIAGIVAIVGLHILQEVAAVRVSVHDTRGVLSVHALPGILSAIASAIVLAWVNKAGTFPESTRIIAVGRDRVDQALWQLAGLGITIVVAAIAGVITGVILKLSMWNQVSDGEHFADTDYFVVPDDFDFTTKIISHIERVELAGGSGIEQQKLLSSVAVTAETPAGQAPPLIDPVVPTVQETIS
jgi:ammonium transporter Rh